MVHVVTTNTRCSNADDSKISAAIRLKLEGPILDGVENWRRGHEKIPSRGRTQSDG